MKKGKNNKDFQPFGDHWRKELRRVKIEHLEQLFHIKYKGFSSKESFINAIRANAIVKKFNQSIKPGQTIIWKSTPEAGPQCLTVKQAAFLSHGNPVAFFEEISGFCSIEPQHVPQYKPLRPEEEPDKELPF